MTIELRAVIRAVVLILFSSPGQSAQARSMLNATNLRRRAALLSSAWVRMSSAEEGLNSEYKSAMLATSDHSFQRKFGLLLDSYLTPTVWLGLIVTDAPSRCSTPRPRGPAGPDPSLHHGFQ